MVTRIVGVVLSFFVGAWAAGQEAAGPAVAPVARYTLVRCGHLIDVPGKPARQGVTLIIRNDRVEGVLPGLDVQPKLQGDAEVVEVDLRDRWVLPGLIDCHVHLLTQPDATARARAMTESPEFVAVRATKHARVNLEAGFTTVRDLGANPQAIFAVRDAINQGLIVGPRIIAAGKSISITGGHGDPTNGFRPDIVGQPTTDDGIADGPEECMKAVRNQVKLGADVIKTTATGGVLSASTAGLAQHYTNPELEAIVQTAHAMGRKVAAHAHGTDGINAAIRAGVDSVEHGTYLDDESIRLLKEREAAGTRCYHVPTLLAARTVLENARQSGFYLPMVAKKAMEVGPRAQANFRRSHAAGVAIAFGTDTGVSPQGQNAREFALMVEGGMTPQEALVAATVTASELLGMEKEIGTLEAGKAADLIAVQGDPLKDITELERVGFVMRAGEVVKK
jgi:imidazolonepropionase-like amidohydrolase